MKADILLDAIGLISDEYVQDAKAVHTKRKKSYTWVKWSAMAAGVCLVFVLGIQSGLLYPSGDQAANNSGSANSEVMNNGTANAGGTAVDENVNSESTASMEGTTESGEGFEDIILENGRIVFVEDKGEIPSGEEQMIAAMKAKLGTEEASIIGGQELVVQYFAKYRVTEEELVEECYHFTVYAETADDTSHLYVFDSDWATEGDATAQIHAKERFVERLLTFVEGLKY